MKAKRRQELETNDLARWFATMFERYGHWAPYVGSALAAVLVVTLAVSLIAGRTSRSRLQAWENFMLARSPDDLERVITEYEGTDVALWAELELADYLCASAHRKLLTDREAAAKELRQAIKHYQRVLNSPTATDMMRQRAALPEAKCWEMLGERRRALDRYEQIARRFAGTPIAAEAKQLRDELASSDAADFYKWFAEYKPPKLPESDTSTPGSDTALPELTVEEPQAAPQPGQQPTTIPELPPEMDEPAEQLEQPEPPAEESTGKEQATDQQGSKKQQASGQQQKADSQPADSQQPQQKPAKPQATDQTDRAPSDSQEDSSSKRAATQKKQPGSSGTQ
jgi:hypothetical protein